MKVMINKEKSFANVGDDEKELRAGKYYGDHKKVKSNRILVIAIVICWAVSALVIMTLAMPGADARQASVFSNKGKEIVVRYIEESRACDDEMDEALSYINGLMVKKEASLRSRIEKERSDIMGSRSSLTTDSEVLEKLMSLKVRRLEIILGMLALAEGYDGGYDPSESDKAHTMAMEYIRNSAEIKGELMDLMDTVNMKWTYDEDGSLRYTN
jgi:hypothetical protein